MTGSAGKRQSTAAKHPPREDTILPCQGVTSENCNFSHWRLQRPWLSLWESCQPNRLTERVLRLMIGKRPLERRTLSVCPIRGSQLSQRESQGRFAPYDLWISFGEWYLFVIFNLQSPISNLHSPLLTANFRYNIRLQWPGGYRSWEQNKSQRFFRWGIVIPI